MTDQLPTDYGIPVNYYEDIKHEHARMIFKSGLNLYMTGPAGCGKTTFARILAGQGNFYLVSCSSDMVPSNLIGHLELKGDSTYFVYGPLTRAMKEGKVLILDEFDRVSEEVASKCHEVLEAGQVLIEQISEMVYCHKDFRIIATGNSKMQGSIQFNTLSLDLASIDRFEFVEFTYPKNEQSILKDMNISDEIIEKIISNATLIRAEENLSIPLSTRRLKAIALLIKQGMTFKEALHYGYLSRLSTEEQDNIRRLNNIVTQRSEVWILKESTPTEVIEDIASYLSESEGHLLKTTLSVAVNEELLEVKDNYLKYIEQVKPSKLNKTKGGKNVI